MFKIKMWFWFNKHTGIKQNKHYGIIQGKNIPSMTKNNANFPIAVTEWVLALHKMMGEKQRQLLSQWLTWI